MAHGVAGVAPLFANDYTAVHIRGLDYVRRISGTYRIARRIFRPDDPTVGFPPFRPDKNFCRCSSRSVESKLGLHDGLGERVHSLCGTDIRHRLVVIDSP